MACTLSFGNITNGQDIFLPFDASAAVVGMPPPGGGSTPNIQAVSRQFDEGELANADTSPSLPQTSAFINVVIDGFQVNTWHSLTLYAWDEASSNATTTTVTFRVADPMPVPLPSPLSPPPPPPPVGGP